MPPLPQGADGFDAAGVERRQVFDLPERLIEVTEHQASVYCCAACGGETKAEFPAGVASAAQYGERIRAAAVYLNVHQLIPEDRVAEAMHDLFGALRLCSDSVANWVRGKAAALAPVAAHIAALAAAAPVRCLDETGFRVAGKGHWLHTIATETLTHYRVSAKRGEMPDGLVGGVAVHDGFKSYSGLTEVGHALCNAHHLRELKALVETTASARVGAGRSRRSTKVDARPRSRFSPRTASRRLSTATWFRSG